MKSLVTLRLFGLVLTGLGLMLFLLAFVALTLDPSRDEVIGPLISGDVSETAKIITAQNPDRGILLHGWLQTNRLDNNATLKVQISIENHSKDVITITELHLMSSGFKTLSPRLPQTPTNVPVGERLVYTEELRPKSWSGRFLIVVNAEFVADRQTYQRGLTLGAVEVTNVWREHILPLARLQGLFLPGILAVLGVGFQVAAQRRAHQAEVWNKLLPQFMERAELHYMPINRASKDLLRDIEKQHKGIGDLRRTFYQLMLFLHRMRSLRQRFGGLTFKSREGEELAAACLVRIRDLADVNLRNLRYRDRVLEAMNDNQTYDAFASFFADPPLSGMVTEQDIAARAYLAWTLQSAQSADQNWQDARRTLLLEPFTELETNTETWMAGSAYDRLRLTLRVLIFVVSIEMNRPLENWYGRRERIDWAGARGLETDLTTANDELLLGFKEYTKLLRDEKRWLTRSR